MNPPAMEAAVTDLIRLCVVCFVVLSGVTSAAGPEPVLLWPDGAPDATGNEEPDQPTIRVYLPEADKATGAGVVICPGGGYGILAMDHEGHQVAKWLARNGVAGFVLRYRHAPKYRHPSPLNDAQRAIRYVRHHADDYNVDPHRVGILGFSAGGHLASTAATHFDNGNSDATDPIGRHSCRPDFAVLCYAVINFVEPWAHKGSARNLLGPEPDPEVLKSLCNDTQVTPETPPTFLFHTAEDPAVPVENALSFFQACRKAKVPAELHIYQDGPHGVGLAPADPAVFGWKDRLKDWMHASGFLSDTKRAAVTGTVTVDGEPLRWGMIALVPTEPNRPRAWAMISRGKYRIPESRGAAHGTNAVEIFDFGSVEPRPTQPDVRQLAPGGRLKVDVADGATEFQFELTV